MESYHIILIVLLISCSLTQCHGADFFFNKTMMSSNPLPTYEGESVEVCVVGRQVSTEVTVTIVGSPLSHSYYDSAVGGSDYSPNTLALVFQPSLESQKCGQFSIIQDGLDETVEYFQLKLERDNGEVNLDSISFEINTCRNKDILLRETSHSVRKAGFKIVEYCNNNSWATLCDDNFTAADAKVVCRQAGYTDVDEYYDIGESIHHSGGQQPMCEGNETHLMQCTMMSTTNSDCHPVLVKCVSSSESVNSNVNIVAAVSVPLLLAVAAGVCATVVVVVVLLLRRRKLKGNKDSRHQIKDEPSSYENTNSHNISSELSSRLGQSNEQSISIRWKRTDNSNTSAVDEACNSATEPEVEYSAPFTQPERRPVLPLNKPKAASLQFNTPFPVEDQKDQRYEGVAVMPTTPATTGQQTWPTAHPGVTAQYSQLEVIPEEYSHLEYRT